MTNLLKQIAGRLPDGYALDQTSEDHSTYTLTTPMGYFQIFPLCGDVGLAPVTILLFDSLPKNAYIELSHDSDGFHFDYPTKNLTGCGYKTAFECVATLYLQLLITDN